MADEEKKSEDSEVFGKIPEENVVPPDEKSDEKIENNDELDEEDEEAVEEDDEEASEEEEEVVESSNKKSSSQKKSSDKTASKKAGAKENSLTENVGFVIKMLFSVILLGIALYAIRPLGSGNLYIIYYVLFIIFSVGTIIFCCVAEKNLFDLTKFFAKFKSSRGQKSDLKSGNKHISQICEAYKESFLTNENYEKTRSNADLYFGGETYFNDMNTLPVQSFLKIIPGTFIGFGILGTFIGFADGLSSINIADSESLLSGVQVLLNGLKSAFNTSIVGVLASMFLNFFVIHPLFNTLDKKSKELCDYLDTKFFVSEVDAMTVTNSEGIQIPFPQVMEIVLEKLEQVASNINQMGATVGEQVSQSVKRTLDKTIEKIIKGEIEKLKTEMNSSINILKEIGTELQNAPTNLKSSAERISEAAEKNNELFQKQNDETIRALNETAGKISDVKNALSPMADSFRNVNNSVQSVAEKLSENQKNLENALSQSSASFEKTSEITSSLQNQITDFSNLLDSYNETNKQSQELLSGFKGMDEQIAKIFGQINENTKSYGEIVGKSLSDYLDAFSKATKDVSAKFADATDSLREEVEKLSKIELEKDGK